MIKIKRSTSASKDAALLTGVAQIQQLQRGGQYQERVHLTHRASEYAARAVTYPAHEFAHAYPGR